MRGAPRQAVILAEIRARIVSGRYGPSTQLPPHKEFAEEFDSSTVTVQLALNRLAREGFVEGRRPLGTFVVEKPPHLNQIALVFVFDPAARYAEERWSRYFQALTQAAVRFQQETGRRVLMFHGIDEHVDSEDRQRLISYIETQRVAGVIFANAPFQLEHTPILDLPGIPRVAVQSEQMYDHVPVVMGDDSQWIDKALDYFASLGHRRVALLDFGMGPQYDALLQAGLEARGMVSHRRWHQYVSMHTPAGARNAVEILMHDSERPDALIVEDDNFVEHALAGLVDAGVRVPACGEPCRTEDVAVVGHANFPVAPAKLLPVRLLGYDANLLLRTCVDLIDRQRRGEPVPGKTLVPMLWEEEVSEQSTVTVGSGKREVGKRKMELAVS
jgi:DNA-binding LacI/PurR family transcriptional regulator